MTSQPEPQGRPDVYGGYHPISSVHDTGAYAYTPAGYMPTPAVSLAPTGVAPGVQPVGATPMYPQLGGPVPVQRVGPVAPTVNHGPAQQQQQPMYAMMVPVMPGMNGGYMIPMMSSPTMSAPVGTNQQAVPMTGPAVQFNSAGMVKPTPSPMGIDRYAGLSHCRRFFRHAIRISILIMMTVCVVVQTVAISMVFGCRCDDEIASAIVRSGHNSCRYYGACNYEPQDTMIIAMTLSGAALVFYLITWWMQSSLKKRNIFAIAILGGIAIILSISTTVLVGIEIIGFGDSVDFSDVMYYMPYLAENGFKMFIYVTEIAHGLFALTMAVTLILEAVHRAKASSGKERRGGHCHSRKSIPMNGDHMLLVDDDGNRATSQ